jgi:hypothetical protein
MRSKLTLITGIVAIAFSTLVSATTATASVTHVRGLGECASACLWTETSYNGTVEALFQSDPSLPSGISNNEKSAADELSGKYVRFYYGPSYSGAWRCYNPTNATSNLSDVTFNKGQGDGGYGQSLYDNIASVGINTSACS